MNSKVTSPIPSGFKLLHTLRGHERKIRRIAWSPDGELLASPSSDATIRLWNTSNGQLVRTLEGHQGTVYCVAWSPDGQFLASGAQDNTIRIWEVNSGNCRHVLTDHTGKVYRVAWSPSGRLASASVDNTIRLWNPTAGILEKTLTGHTGMVLDVAWSPDQTLLASSSSDHTIRLWDAITGELRQPPLLGHYDVVFSVAWSPTGNKLLASCGSDRTIRLWEWDGQGWRQTNVLEGHTQVVVDVGFSSDGRLLASKSRDHTVRLWRCDNWKPIAILDEPASPWGLTGLAFHPRLADGLATLGEGDGVVRLWELNRKLLMRRDLAPDSVRYATAKIVLVGDAGVGKTCLGWRLAHGNFREHSSTHGQQFWMVDTLSTQLDDGTECEAVLWDLAGQPDYRLIHALFLDDAYLALVLFDPTDRQETLKKVEYWLKMLSDEQGRIKCRIILIGARLDRGYPAITTDEIEAFCHDLGISGGYVGTRSLSDLPLKHLIFSELRFLVILKKQFKISILLIKSDRLLVL